MSFVEFIFYTSLRRIINKFKRYFSLASSYNEENLKRIISELKPYEDKVVLTPLSEEEIEEIQANFDKPLPKYFKEYLTIVGVKQDFIFETLDSVDRFEDLSDFLNSEDYFRFADNGGEDYWLLSLKNVKDRNIYEYEFYNSGEIVPLNKTFDELLEENIERIKNQYSELIPNSQKRWMVQFSANTGSADFLVKEISKKSNIQIELVEKPRYIETSSAGVKCFEGKIRIEGLIYSLRKQIIKGQGSSDLYFDMEEVISEIQNNSLIKRIDKALENCIFSHGMTDYGILPKINE